MRRRELPRLRRRPRRLSLTPPGLGSRLRAYVNHAPAPQAILAVVVVMIMVAGVSGAVAAMTGWTGQGVTSGKRMPNSPPPATPSITTDQSTNSVIPDHGLPLDQHVTHDGETIASIASATGRSTETLLWANNIPEPDEPLPADTQIKIPPLDGLLHVVQAGDTLESIASAVDAQPGDITGYAPNHVTRNEDLTAGQQILIPGASVQERQRIVTYDVRPGDTVGTIAGRFGLEPSTVLSANEMAEPKLIYAGQELIIPPPRSMVAKVQPGDSLNTLADRWGVDPETIAEYPGNGITDPDALVAGQALIIPIEQAPVAPAGTDPGTTGTPTAGVPPETGSSDANPTSGDPATSTQSPEETTAPSMPSAEPGQTPPATSQRPATEAVPTQEPVASPSPEAEDPTPPQSSPAITKNTRDTELSPAAHPRGNFIWPAKGTITQHFGPTSAATDPPYEGHPHFHTGLDIANDVGTPVVAADDGTVAFAGWSTDGLGNSVKIDHADGFVTWYGHLAEPPSLRSGEKVGKGEFLGPMGNTGNSEGPQVHFKIVHHDTYLNPIDHLP